MVYQVAEALGTTAESVRDSMTPTELAEWAYYLNSPFSRKGRETLMNGWIVHTIRSIMADKRHKPEFQKSVFPFDKVYKQFFDEGKVETKGGVKKADRLAAVAHGAQVIHQAWQKKRNDYLMGKVPNKYGLYVGERMKA